MMAASLSIKQLCFRPWLYLLVSSLNLLSHLTLWVGNQCVDATAAPDNDDQADPLANLVLPQPAMDLLRSPDAPLLTPALNEVLTVISQHYAGNLVRKIVLEEAMQSLLEDNYPDLNEAEQFALLDDYANRASISLQKQALEGLLQLETSEDT